MLAALPDAGSEVEPRLRVWDAVPVENQLWKKADLGREWNSWPQGTYPSVLDCFFVCFAVRFVEG